MNVLITGDKGFVASNLPAAFAKYDAKCVNLDDVPDLIRLNTGEVCIHRNSRKVWADLLTQLDIDLVVHNAAVVGTDVVALNQSEATLTNVQGTYNIVQACNDAEVSVCYLGTTVIYDTKQYQDHLIEVGSVVKPATYYGMTKKLAEDVILNYADNWLIMRPLFAYGGIGDMNSLIAKTFYAYKSGRTDIDIFLDSEKIKDYIHVTDFCDAVAHVCCKRGILQEHFNVAAETPHITRDIVHMMSDVCDFDLEHIIKWHPETDYLGNHRLSSLRMRQFVHAWEPKISLKDGILDSWRSIISNRNSATYNPMMHLDDAKNRAIDLTSFYPKKTGLS